MGKIYIHIGYPKCASSYFQQNYFSNCDGINYIGKNNSDFFDVFFRSQESRYNTDYMRSMIPDNEKPTLISIEALVGIASKRRSQTKLFANRLYEIFPDAEIIIFIRNQVDVIESIISEWMMHGQTGFYDVNTFFDLSSGPELECGFDCQYFNYGKTLKIYSGLFGDNNVHILLFEDFIRDKKKFIDSLFGVLGADYIFNSAASPQRRKLSPLSHFLIKYVNVFRKGVFNPKGIFRYESVLNRSVLRIVSIVDHVYYKYRSGSRHKLMNDETASLVKRYYSDSNKEVERIVRRDLKSYNYY